MPKLRNIPVGDLQVVLNAVDNVIDELHGINHHAEQGRIDLPPDPLSAVRTLASVARAAVTLQSALLAKIALEEQRRELEQLVRANEARKVAAGKASE